MPSRSVINSIPLLGDTNGRGRDRPAHGLLDGTSTRENGGEIRRIKVLPLAVRPRIMADELALQAP
jgi:hypothetical protein